MPLVIRWNVYKLYSIVAKLLENVSITALDIELVIFICQIFRNIDSLVYRGMQRTGNTSKEQY